MSSAPPPAAAFCRCVFCLSTWISTCFRVFRRERFIVESGVACVLVFVLLCCWQACLGGVGLVLMWPPSLRGFRTSLVLPDPLLTRGQKCAEWESSAWNGEDR